MIFHTGSDSLKANKKPKQNKMRLCSSGIEDVSLNIIKRDLISNDKAVNTERCFTPDTLLIPAQHGAFNRLPRLLNVASRF